MSIIAKQILDRLNQKTGKDYRPVSVNLNLILERLKEYTPDELMSMIDFKVRQWSDGEMRQYLRPATLFNRTKCAQYIGETPKEKLPQPKVKAQEESVSQEESLEQIRNIRKKLSKTTLPSGGENLS